MNKNFKYTEEEVKRLNELIGSDIALISALYTDKIEKYYDNDLISYNRYNYLLSLYNSLTNFNYMITLTECHENITFNYIYDTYRELKELYFNELELYVGNNGVIAKYRQEEQDTEKELTSIIAECLRDKNLYNHSNNTDLVNVGIVEKDNGVIEVNTDKQTFEITCKKVYEDNEGVK